MPAKPPAPVYLPAFQRLVPDLLGDAWAEDDGLAPADVAADVHAFLEMLEAHGVLVRVRTA